VSIQAAPAGVERAVGTRSRLTRQDMEAILEVTRHLAAPFELTVLLAEVTAAARRVLRSERASVWLFDEATEELVLEVASDIRHLRILYRCDTEGEPVFVEVPAPTDEALQVVLHKVIIRLIKLLTRRGVLVEEQGQTCVADSDGDSDQARTLRPLQAAACT